MKIDVDKFVESLIKRYHEAHNIDSTTTKCWLDDVLEDQGLKYEDGKIVKPSEPLWYDHVREVRHEALEKAKQDKNSESEYEDISLVDDGENGVLLYFSKDGRGLSSFRITKMAAKWLRKKLGNYLKEQDTPDLVGMKELGKVWDEKQDPILQRLDRIYDLLLHKLNEKIIINNPFPRLTETPYKLGEIWCDSASASTEKKNEP